MKRTGVLYVPFILFFFINKGFLQTFRREMPTLCAFARKTIVNKKGCCTPAITEDMSPLSPGDVFFHYFFNELMVWWMTCGRSHVTSCGRRRRRSTEMEEPWESATRAAEGRRAAGATGFRHCRHAPVLTFSRPSGLFSCCPVPTLWSRLTCDAVAPGDQGIRAGLSFSLSNKLLPGSS